MGQGACDPVDDLFAKPHRLIPPGLPSWDPPTLAGPPRAAEPGAPQRHRQNWQIALNYPQYGISADRCPASPHRGAARARFGRHHELRGGAGVVALRRRRNGFTLLELMVVITILALLMGLGVG
ncbi:MAG: Tfp pilus assembly protein FimT/FimU, partial [Nitrospinota bacterium]